MDMSEVDQAMPGWRASVRPETEAAIDEALAALFKKTDRSGRKAGVTRTQRRDERS